MLVQVQLIPPLDTQRGRTAADTLGVATVFSDEIGYRLLGSIDNR